MSIFIHLAAVPADTFGLQYVSPLTNRLFGNSGGGNSGKGGGAQCVATASASASSGITPNGGGGSSSASATARESRDGWGSSVHIRSMG